MMHSRWCERHDKLDDRKAQYIDELIKSADPVMSRVNSSGILYITLTLPEGKAILRASCFDSMFNWGLHSASHGQGHMYFKAMNTEIDDDILGALKYSGHGALAESLWQHWNLPF